MNSSNNSSTLLAGTLQISATIEHEHKFSPAAAPVPLESSRLPATAGAEKIEQRMSALLINPFNSDLSQENINNMAKFLASQDDIIFYPNTSQQQMISIQADRFILRAGIIRLKALDQIVTTVVRKTTQVDIAHFFDMVINELSTPVQKKEEKTTTPRILKLRQIEDAKAMIEDIGAISAMDIEFFQKYLTSIQSVIGKRDKIIALRIRIRADLKALKNFQNFENIDEFVAELKEIQKAKLKAHVIFPISETDIFLHKLTGRPLCRRIFSEQLELQMDGNQQFKDLTRKLAMDCIRSELTRVWKGFETKDLSIAVLTKNIVARAFNYRSAVAHEHVKNQYALFLSEFLNQLVDAMQRVVELSFKQQFPDIMTLRTAFPVFSPFKKDTETSFKLCEKMCVASRADINLFSVLDISHAVLPKNLSGEVLPSAAVSLAPSKQNKHVRNSSAFFQRPSAKDDEKDFSPEHVLKMLYAADYVKFLSGDRLAERRLRAYAQALNFSPREMRDTRSAVPAAAAIPTTAAPRLS